MNKRSQPGDELYTSLHATLSPTVSWTAFTIAILYTVGILVVGVIEAAPVGDVLLAGAVSSCIGVLTYVVVSVVLRILLRVVTRRRWIQRVSALATFARPAGDGQHIGAWATVKDAFGPQSHAVNGIVLVIGAWLLMSSTRLKVPIFTATGDYVPVFSVLVGVLFLLAGRNLLSFETFRATAGRVGVLVMFVLLLGGALWAGSLAFAPQRPTTEAERSLLFSVVFLAFIRAIGCTIFDDGPPRRVVGIGRAYEGASKQGRATVEVVRTSRRDPNWGTRCSLREDGIRSTTGFDWGTMNDGGFELSRAILVDASGFSQVPSWLIQRFQQDVVRRLRPSWSITIHEVENWLRSFDGEQPVLPTSATGRCAHACGR